MYNIWGMTDIGLVRNENQDAYAIQVCKESGHVICVVCDGMGGPTGGQLASTLAVDTFLSSCQGNLVQNMNAEEIRNVAEFAVSTANSAVYARSREDEEHHGMGTTLVSAIVWDNKALINNVGDSRAYLIRSEEETDCIHRITKDHSVVEKLVEMGNITEEEARTHPDRNLITRALGPDPDTLSDAYLVDLRRGDYLLLCTDGLIGTVTDEEMAHEVLCCNDKNNCLNRLLELSKSRGAADNVTAVLLQMQ